MEDSSSQLPRTGGLTAPALTRPSGTRPVIVNGKIEWIPLPKRAPPPPPSSSSSSSSTSSSSSGNRLKGNVTLFERVSELVTFILYHRWTLVGLIVYLCLVRYINNHKWGAVITMLFAILAMVTIGLGKSNGDTNNLSPYYILNKGAQSLAGQYHASALDRERRLGAGGVVGGRNEEEFANVFAGSGRRINEGQRLGHGSGNDSINENNSGLRQRLNGKVINQNKEEKENKTQEGDELDEGDEQEEIEDAELEEAIARSLSER